MFGSLEVSLITIVEHRMKVHIIKNMEFHTELCVGSWEPLCEPIFYVFVLRVTKGPRVKLASCKSALNPQLVYSDRSQAVVPVLVLLFEVLWFIRRGDLFYVLPCVILFLCFSVLLALRLPCLGKRES